MAAFSSFRPYVLSEVPGCPQVMVDDAIRLACRTLSVDTWLIHEDLATFSTVVGTQSYALAPLATQVITSGTSDGGSTTTLIHSTATFVTSGVLAGDTVFDDTNSVSVVIVSVDSETQVTVTAVAISLSGVAYRIARTTTEVFGVNLVILDGKEPPLSRGDDTVVRRYVSQTGTPSYFWFKDGRLWFDRVPDTVMTVQVDALVRPLLTAAVVDDAYVEYRDAVAAQAKHSLMQMAGKPWADPNEAQKNFVTYTSLVGDQKIKAASGRVARPLRAVAAFF